MLTQFFEGVVDFTELVVVLQQFGSCVQSIVSVFLLLWHRVHRHLEDVFTRISTIQMRFQLDGL